MENKFKLLGERFVGSQRKRIARFGRDEDGGMVIFTLFVLVLMLIISGMAVDFMRFESRRALMQGALDRGVLAAANLNQSQNAAAVARDYVAKAELGDCLTGDPVVNDSNPSYRSVSATCALDLNTFYLRLIGMDTLQALANSTAVQGVSDVEVSLVLDVSGSMYQKLPGTNVRRIERLRTAASAFVNTLLAPEFKDKISVSLIPYSEHVNIGPELFNALNVTRVHGFSNCVEIPSSEYTTTTFNGGATYVQTQAFQSNTFGNGGFAPNTSDSTRNSGNATLDQPFCPRYSFEQIIPITQNKAQLLAAIGQFQARSGTSIFLGLKWAVNLLDPSIKPTLANLPASMIESKFDNRPAAYALESQANVTSKYIVLMTDGQNDSSNRLKPEFYDTPSEIQFWGNNNFPFFINTIGGGDWGLWNTMLTTNFYTPDMGDTFMQQMCTAAKNKGIIIYSIAMSVGDNSAGAIRGRSEMQKCASSPGHFFATSGDELVQIFEAIADQITDLRLTL